MPKPSSPFAHVPPYVMDRLARGVHIAPWMGPQGEIVLLAVRADGRLARPPHMIPQGADHVGASDDLWEVLEREDADARPYLRAI